MAATRINGRRLGGAAIVLAALLAAAPAGAQVANDGVHVGVATCASNNCHGKADPPTDAQLGQPGFPIRQNEYLIWIQRDKHAKAYEVLKEERGERIARNLGLPNAENAALCLDCHADNVPAARRGPRFQISDGVGCESCHGGAVNWLGPHVQGNTHKENIAAGMFPTESPQPRAEKCLSCHIGGDKRFVTHQIMGAGHPPMPFELDTYTAIEPAHYTVTKRYIERKGLPNDIQFWAVGQAVDVKTRMDFLLDPNNAPKGANPELVLFDCQACHHAMDQVQWRARASTGLEPGRLRVYDATVVMLRVIAQRAAPEAAKELSTHMLALHRATTDAKPDYWAGVLREAKVVREAADKLIPALAQHEFTAADAKELALAVLAVGLEGDDLDYSGAQQETMALQSIVAAMKALKYADETQVAALNTALGDLYKATESDQTYRPEIFVEALKGFAAKLPK
jgi:hypothetical protein